jgi:hypothetical protein
LNISEKILDTKPNETIAKSIDKKTLWSTDISVKSKRIEELTELVSEMLLFSNELPCARFEAIMTNLDAQKESYSMQFGSFGYWFYYYFN